MFLINLKLALRNLLKFKGIHFLNIAGLALGITAAIFVYLWVQDELSFDRFHADADRMYRVEALMNWGGEKVVWSVTQDVLEAELENRYAEVEEAIRLKRGYNPVIVAGEQVFYEDHLMYGKEDFFSFFDFPLLQGDPETLLDDPYKVVISEKTAHKIFGDQNPIGQTLRLDKDYLLTVSGVMKDFPHNSHLQIDYLVSFDLRKIMGERFNRWDRYDFVTYVKLKEGVDAAAFNEKLGLLMSEVTEDSGDILFINPLSRLHLYNDPSFVTYDRSLKNRGPIVYVILFSIIGGLILLIASMNFVNLSTAISTHREKEVGIRKVSGAGKKYLMKQLFGEAFMQVFLSTAVALMIVLLALPLFNQLSGKEIAASYMLHPRMVLGILGLFLLTGFLSGIYPALVLSAFKPVKILKKAVSSGKKGSGLRRALVIAQFTITVVFMISILVIKDQMHYMQNKNLGFDKEQVLVIYPRNVNVALLQERIAGLSGVKETAIGGNVPVNMGNVSTFSKWDGNTDGKKVMFHMFQVDEECMDLLGFEMAYGEAFPKVRLSENEVLVNEAAVAQMGLEDPIGKRIFRGGEPRVIRGVVKDFHYRPLNEEINPVYFYQDKEWWSQRIFVRLHPQTTMATHTAIIDMMKEMSPDYPPKTYFLDDQISHYYDAEYRLSQLLDVATLLTIITACLGLFGLAALSARQRLKEVGIRKVHGASVMEILSKFNGEFVRLILFANLLAWPIAWFVMKKWLDGYAYSVKMNPLFLFVSLAVVVLITLLTVSFQTGKAANSNPAQTLRDE